MDKDIHSLKEILLDAARYRWIRRHPYMFSAFVAHTDLPFGEKCDDHIDEMIGAENE